MKKSIIIASTFAVTAIAAQGASLISGWDMTTLSAPTNGSVAGNWSDITGDGIGNSNGTIYWDGTNGSSNIIDGTVGGAATESSNVGLNTTIASRAFNNEMSLAPALSVGFANGFSFNATGNSFVIATEDGASYNNIILSFAAALTNPGSAIDISWEYDNGSGFVSTGITTSTATSQGAGGELETVALNSGLTFDGGIVLRGTFGTIDNNSQILIDNVQINGDLVPEPATYAMIVGVAVLGLAYVRRRRT